MGRRRRKYHSGDIKARAVLESIRGMRTMNEIASDYEIHPMQISKWKVVQNTKYTPFGSVWETSADLTDRTYTGQRKDNSTGLMYYRARYYDPAFARFISPDPLTPRPYDPQALNRYTYCRNNPIIYTDPSGHDFGLSAFIITTVVSAAMGGTHGNPFNANNWQNFDWKAAGISAAASMASMRTYDWANGGMQGIVAGSMAGGAVSGGLGTSGNVLEGALIGGMSGVASGLVTAGTR